MINIEELKNPPASFRVVPFWFWNGEMKDEEIIFQINEMGNKGIGGFFICARQGLTVPYLSNEWFEKIRVAIKAAQENNLEVWLYDEYPYPSGMAGGEVTLEHPETKQKTLHYFTKTTWKNEKIDILLPWGRVLAAKAVPLDDNTEEKLWHKMIDLKDYVGNEQVEPVYQKTGLTYYNNSRFFSYNTKKRLYWNPSQDKTKWMVFVFLEKEMDEFKYYGTYVDPCHNDAVESFINTTHERYKREIGEHFGETVKGIFTDETGLLGEIPWTPKLKDYFKNEVGYDLEDNLISLIENRNDSAKLRYDYFQALHEVFRETFHKKIHNWCKQNQLKYVTEVPSARMTTQLYSDIPGGDAGHEKLGRSLDWMLSQDMGDYRSNSKMISSIASQLGKDKAMLECFHSIGWSMTLQDAKWMVDRLAALGINFFNFHAYFYTIDGLTQHDAPPSQFVQNPYWKHYRQFSDYTARVSYMLSLGKADMPVALLDPITSLWTHMGNSFHKLDYAGSDNSEKKKLEELKQHWLNIIKTLLYNYTGYEHLDPEMLANCKIEDSKLTIGNSIYEVLVIPPITNLEDEAWQNIKLFLEQGGTVISVGSLPIENINGEKYERHEMYKVFDADSLKDYQNGMESKKLDYTKGKHNAFFIPINKESNTEKYLTTLNELIKSKLSSFIQFETEEQKKDFLLQHRFLSESESIVFISNQEYRAQKTYLTISNEKENYECHGIDLNTGEFYDIPIKQTASEAKLMLNFSAYESMLIKLRKLDEKNEIDSSNKSIDCLQLDASGLWDVKPLQDNAIRFDHFDFTCGNEVQDKGKEVKVKPFMNQYFEMDEIENTPLKFEQDFGIPPKVSFSYPLKCSYKKEFNILQIPYNCKIMKDKLAILGDFEIKINGYCITENDFKFEYVYDSSNQVCDVQKFLKKGTNIIEINVIIKNDWEGLVDAIFLVGPFGVYFDENMTVLSKQNEKSHLKNGPYHGYPYYAGTFNFQKTVNLKEIPSGERFNLEFLNWDANFHDSAVVKINGNTLGCCSWSPYRWEGETKILQSGYNNVEVEVTNTLIGLLEGKYFDYDSHTLKDVRHIEK